MKKICLFLFAAATFSLTFTGCQETLCDMETLEIISSDVGFDAAGGSGSIKLNAPVEKIRAVSDKNWLTITTATASEVSYAVSENDDALQRSAKITISAGELSRSVTIIQKGALFDISEDGTIEIDPSGQTPYRIEYESSLSSAPEVTIPQEAQQWLSATVEDGEIVLSASLNDTGAARECTITITQAWKPVELTVTQHVFMGGGNATSYDAWLGEWEVKRGANTDIWKISEAQTGSTYTITGIEGKTFPVEATYVSASGGIEVCAQDDLGQINAGQYGTCTVGLFGGWGEGNFATGTYTIFTGTVTGNTAKLTPGTVSSSPDESYVLEKMHLIATTSDSKYVRISEDSTPLPTTITRKGGSGEGPGPGDGSEPYNKWIGSWSFGSGENAFEMKLKQKVADKSYNMRGWQFEEEFFNDVEVTFGNGEVTLYANDDVPVASNVDIGAEEGPCNLYYVGWFTHTDGKEYYITSGGKGAYDVAIGKIGSDDNATFTGTKFSVQSGGDFQFTRLTLIAVPISDPEGGVYTFNNSPDDFPLTATKSGSKSSARSVGTASPSITSGNWIRTSAKAVKIAEAKPVETALEYVTFGECTPYTAVREIPARPRKHLKYNN